MLDAFICDAPARALLKCTKGHNGYHACERCTQSGVYTEGRVTFPEVTAPARTNVAFDELRDEEHHITVSPLKELDIGCVTMFVLDYMHPVCLGVVRKLIFLWIKGPLKCRIPASLLTVVSTSLLSVRQSLARDFSRKPRSLNEACHWKATELRQFMLYTGPVLLRDKLPKHVYQHFLLLSVSMRCLLSPNLCFQFADYVEELLVVFVRNFATIYGKEMLVYNVHSLIHLVEDVRRYGALDNVSCFPFENFLGKLKRMVRRPQDPVSQIVQRINERERSLENKNAMKSESLVPVHRKAHMTGPLPEACANCFQYKLYVGNSSMVSCSKGDHCFQLNGEIVIIRNILHFPLG